MNDILKSVREEEDKKRRFYIFNSAVPLKPTLGMKSEWDWKDLNGEHRNSPTIAYLLQCKLNRGIRVSLQLRPR